MSEVLRSEEADFLNARLKIKIHFIKVTELRLLVFLTSILSLPKSSDKTSLEIMKICFGRCRCLK